MNEATGFYVPGEGWLHRMHPVPKLLIITWGVIAPFVLPAAVLPALVLGAVLLGVSAGLGGPYLRAVFWATVVLVASIILVNGFFFPGAHDVLFSIGPFDLTREGLAYGVPIALRVIVAIAVTLAVVMSTRPDDLMEGLVQRGVNPKLAFVVLSAIQTIPRMLAKAARILDAQQARGLRTEGSVRARLRAILPLLGPLIIGSLIDVRERSLALEARAFGSSARRTAYRVVDLRPTDRRATSLVLLALAALAVWAMGRVAGLLPG